MNQAVRAAENQWQDSFLRSLIYTACFYFREALSQELESVIKARRDKCQGCTRGTLRGAAFPICGERLVGQLGCFSPACIEKAEDETWERWWETGQMVLKRAFQTTHAAFSIHQILAACPQEALWEPSNHVGLVSPNQLTSIFAGKSSKWSSTHIKIHQIFHNECELNIVSVVLNETFPQSLKGTRLRVPPGVWVDVSERVYKWSKKWCGIHKYQFIDEKLAFFVYLNQHKRKENRQWRGQMSLPVLNGASMAIALVLLRQWGAGTRRRWIYRMKPLSLRGKKALPGDASFKCA